MRRLLLVAVMAGLAAGCEDPRRAGEPELRPVDFDTLAWFREGRTVEYAGHRWVMVGPPVYEPLALTNVAEFEGTPLYAERGVTSPPRRIYIPVGGGYWQMLERGAPPAEPPAEGADADVPEGTAEHADPADLGPPQGQPRN
jgi:hypothetical protein